MQVFSSSRCFLVLSLVTVLSVLVSSSSSVAVSATQDPDTTNARTHLRAQRRQLNPVAPGTPTNCKAKDFELPAALVGAWSEAGMPPFITKEIFGLIVGMADGWTPGFAQTETPIIVRLVHLIDTMHWNCVAAYSSTWLDGLNRQDPLVRSPQSFNDITFHASTPRFLCMVHAYAAVVDDWHPEAKTSLAGVLSAFQYQDVEYGFNTDVDVGFHADTGEANKNVLLDIAARHCYNPKIMGAIVAKQMTEYGRRDGYNMYGDLGRDGKPCFHNCRRYTDSTGYESGMNKNISAAFRWQPMLEDNGRGYFTEQQFVTPHIGETAKRAILSDHDFNSRLAEGVEGTYDKPWKDHKEEARNVAERLRQTATDDMKKAKIEFYDNKIAVGMAILKAVAAYGPSFEQMINYAFGMSASEYDSLLVAWKEKVTHDRVRPTTWIQNKMSEEDFVTYGGPFQGVQTIKGKEFESWSRVMPHSEYISGSACICQSLADYTDDWMDRSRNELQGYEGAPVFQSGGSITVMVATEETGRAAPFVQGSSSTEPGVSPANDLTLVVDSMSMLRDQCGQSRLDGGMHFALAVEHAYPLCEGIGQLAAEYSMHLLGSGGWEDVQFGFCERSFFTDDNNACTAHDPVTGWLGKECTHAAGCPSDVADGTYPDLTKRNSYCVCQQGFPATYTRCDTNVVIADEKYDAFASSITNAYLTTSTDDGIPLGCGGYAGTTQTGVCVAKDDVSLKGRNNKSYKDPAQITCPFVE
mmetsp:Transcript_5313/g.5920  ORF Transcript_5313/g.5920 Transcript_5313/m.5920 type:complete len:751 (+) Transcript_5313:127-2379(+)